MKKTERTAIVIGNMRKLRRLALNILVLHFFAILVLAGQAEAGISISGTISNNTGKSGRIYITANANGNSFGTSIASAGAYTIQGVPPGEYIIKAFLDSQNIGRQVQTSPTGSYSPLLVSGTNVTGIDITLTEPAPIAPPAPQNVRVHPGDASALIRWDKNKSNDIYTADTYDVYWSMSATVGKTTFEGSRIGIPAGNDAPAILTGLSNGASYYFVVIPKSGGVEGVPSTVFGPVIIGAATGANTVSGTVTFSGTQTGPLYVAIVNNSSRGKMFFTSFANPVFPQNFSITGVPDGVYSVYPILDINNDKLIDIGDITATDDSAPTITLNGSGASGVIAPLVSANAVANIRTEHQNYGTDWYNINFNINGQLKQPAGVTLLSGPNINEPIDFGIREGKFYGWNGGSTRPTVGSSYTFQVKYADNSTENLSAAISAVLDSFPANPQVLNSDSSTPVFTWEAPTTTPPANFHYELWLNAVNENYSFWESRLPASQLSATFNYDGGAEKPLVLGTSYNWSIAVSDAYGNKAVKSASFTNGNAASGGISGKITNQAGVGIAGIWISVNSTTGGYNGYSGSTQSDGTFTISGVPAGNYNLLINGTNEYASQWYNNVAVVTGTTTANINATLAVGGTISGTVTNSAGTPLSGIPVFAADEVTGYYSSGAQTDIAGKYTIIGLPSGSYKVQFNHYNNTNNYVFQFYSNQTTYSSATPVPVTAGTATSNINAILIEGGTITGTVTNSSGAPLSGVYVNAYNTATSDQYPGTITDASGNYTISGLWPGSYRVEFISSFTNSQYYNNQPTHELATLVTVTANTTTSGINAVLQPGVSGSGSISGMVKDSAGSGIADVRVNVTDSNNTYFSATTSSDGSYTVSGIPAGSAKVSFIGNYVTSGTGYINQWYSNKTTSATADPVVVTAGMTTTGINATLLPGGRISGRVTNSAGAGIAGVVVFYSNISGTTTGTTTYLPTTSADGSYTIGGIPAGSYRIRFESMGDTTYAAQWYNNKTSSAAADPVVVNVGSTTSEVNAVLGLGGSIAGTVKNQAGAGIPDITVILYDANGVSYGLSSQRTQADGSYTFNGLPTGSYKVYFRVLTTSAGYVGQWYNNKLSSSDADLVVVTAGASTSGISAVLAPGGSITGKVTNSRGTGIAGITVNIMDALGTASGIVTTTRTDGTYTAGVPTGSWKVLFSDKSAQNADQWYNNKSSASSADLLSVATGVTLSNIDAVLLVGNPIVVASSSGSGTLVCSGTVGGVAYSGDCSTNFDSGTTITAQATPSIGYLFAGWGGACSGNGACSITSGSAPVYAGFIDTKTLGGVPNEGNLSITLENDGKIGIKRFNAGTWQDQVYNWNSKGSLLYSGGISYGFGYFTGNASSPPVPDPTATIRVSDSQYKNVWLTADNIMLTQTIHYQPGAQYYSVQWDIVNNGTTTLNDLRFFHAQDTYFYGSDNGAGFWDALNTTVGVEKHVADSSGGSTTTLKRMSLQAVTPPYAYDSMYYYEVATNVVKYALSNTLNTNETTDNGYAMEWRSATLAPGATWSIAANEKFADVQVVGGISVKAPVATNCVPGSTCTLNFTLTNSGALQTVELTSDTDQTGWSSSLTSSSVIMAPGSTQQIAVNVAISGTTANGVIGHVKLTANTASDTASVNAVLPLEIVTTTLPNTKINQTGYSQTIASIGGIGTITFSHTGTIPNGMTLSSTGVLSGTPTTVGTFSFTVKATDSVGAAKTKDFSVTITPEDLIITTAAIPDAQYGKSFSQQLAATGGTAPYSWTTTQGSAIPAGLSLSSGGVISGTPVAPGSYSFEVNVADTATIVTKKTMTILVDKATLTVTPTSLSRVFGVENPALTSTFSGFVNNDTSESVTGTALLTTTATSSSPVGSYPITATAGSLASSKYVFVFTGGTLTITKATPVITWANPAAITFGTALSATQFNAVADVPGTFAYAPAVGTVPNLGTQALSVTFTPTDSVNYDSHTVQTTLAVNSPPPVIVTTPVAQVATGSDGALVTTLEMTSATSKIIISTGTKMTDSSGKVITGTLSVAANPLASLPTTAAAAFTSDGKKLVGQGGAIEITISNGTSTVKTITPPMSVNLAVSSTFAAPGSVVQYFSYDGSVWTLEGTATVKADGTIDLLIGHLSIWGIAKFEAPIQLPSGDINGDGKVDITDALKALQIAVGMFTPSTPELAAGDVAPLVSGKPVPNGEINVGDAVLILQKSVGLVSW